ncbi:hypothetical protein Apa02nite_097970 [Actinoplanes palleronii]|uniref:Uncharacterized protein n=2 Tax=Actinoplanes palleronii TaxID=113570 RepID=A0ABQ4BSM3_9ACTN|nr:hypothetical protein Apa02nite_097970 [Actinoplanes palleronii]
MLLHGAVQTSASLNQIRRLTALAPDPISVALVDDAISLMAEAHANLLSSADQVAEDPPPA